MEEFLERKIKKSNNNMDQFLAGIALFSCCYLILLLGKMLNAFPESVNVEQIAMCMGGVSSIFYLFGPKSLLSQFLTLYSVFLSSCYFLVIKTVAVLNIAICVFGFICVFVFFSFLFMSEKVSQEKHYNKCFILFFSSRFLILPELVQWEIALVLQIIFLFVFDYLERIFLFGSHYREYQEYNQHRKGVFISLTVLFLMSFLYIYSTGVIWDIKISQICCLATAGAGGVQFMLSKTKSGQTLAFLVYIINNVFLGFILRKEGETFPKITIYFLIGILCLFILLWLVSKIKREKISDVGSESKTTPLQSIFFWILVSLNRIFLSDEDVDLTLWINSFVTQITVLLGLQFILKKEDQAPDREEVRGALLGFLKENKKRIYFCISLFVFFAGIYSFWVHQETLKEALNFYLQWKENGIESDDVGDKGILNNSALPPKKP